MIKIFTLLLSDYFWGYKMFTITGTFQGRAATIKYSADKDDPHKGYIFTGDPEIIEKARYENMQDHGSLGIAPDTIEAEYLSYELSAYDLLRLHVFESIISEENDWEPYDPDVTY